MMLNNTLLLNPLQQYINISAKQTTTKLNKNIWYSKTEML